MLSVVEGVKTEEGARYMCLSWDGKRREIVGGR